MPDKQTILMIDFTNYVDYPIGGFLSFSRNMLSSFGSQMALVGITTDKNEPVGSLFEKRIDDTVYNFFAFARYSKLRTRHIIPDRIACFVLLRYYKKKITCRGYKNVFIQRQEILPAVKHFGYKNICYRFPGVENPLTISKYPGGKYFHKHFDKVFFASLNKVRLILAAADQAAIGEMILRSKNSITSDSVVQFPTRINTDIYKPVDKRDALRKLNIPESSCIITTTGRLAALKGWKFMVDCFFLFSRVFPDSMFYIIGTGEDYQALTDYLTEKKLTGRVILTGRKQPEEISLYLNACDLFIMGSYKEGWSTSLSEAIACGIPACVTSFSSARDIIVDGKNGYVIEEHNEDLFVQGMLKALKIKRPVYNENILRYSTKLLKKALLDLWELD